MICASNKLKPKDQTNKNQNMSQRERRRSNNHSSRRRAYLKNQASELLQDGVAPASKAPNELAPKIANKRQCRKKQKAQEQARYELLKCKASHVAISSAEATTTVGRREASQGGATHTVTAAYGAQQTT